MRNGFTLIELLLVVVIIGIVAALVLPKFGDVKQKAYVTAMKSDLRNFTVAQEIYQDKNGTYATTPAAAGVTASDNVTISVDSLTTEGGYVASTTHSKVASTKCSIRVGQTGTNVNKIVCA